MAVSTTSNRLTSYCLFLRRKFIGRDYADILQFRYFAVIKHNFGAITSVVCARVEIFLAD